jgi:hypothetical protein
MDYIIHDIYFSEEPDWPVFHRHEEHLEMWLGSLPSPLRQQIESRSINETVTAGKLGNNSICANIQNTKLRKEGKKRKGKRICGSYLSLALHASLASYSEFWASCLRPKCLKSEP